MIAGEREEEMGGEGRVPDVWRRKAAAAALPRSRRGWDRRRRPRGGPASAGDGCVGGGNGPGGKSERQMRGELDLVGPAFHAWRVSFPTQSRRGLGVQLRWFMTNKKSSFLNKILE